MRWLVVTAVLVVACLSRARQCSGARILFVVAPIHSHVSQHVAIMTELVRRGHDVTLAVAETFPVQRFVKDTGINVLTFKAPPPEIPQIFGKEFDEFVIKPALENVPFKTIVAQFGIRGARYCDALLSDDAFMKKVRGSDFHLAFLDVMPAFRCSVLLAKKQNLPFVTEEPYPEVMLAGAPFWPVAAPLMMSPKSVATMNSFPGKLGMFMMQALYETKDFPTDVSWLIEKHLPGSGVCLRDLLKESEFWFFTAVNLLMDYPRALTPNTACVGGLTTGPAKPLHGNLDEFVRTAQHGVIVVSFGTVAKNVPAEYLQRFMDAFARIQQRVVMRVNDVSRFKASENVLLQTWLPQNDLLAHENTRLFVTHGGANSVYEALYHGVPMLGMAIIPNDQPYNVRKIAQKGYGLSLDFHTSTSDDVYNALTAMLNDPTYAKNVRLASRRFTALPMTPIETATFWVDHVVTHGGAHLRPLSLNMSVWSYLMLDIYAFLILCLLLVFSVLYYFSKCVFSRFCIKMPHSNLNKKNK